MKQLKLVVLAVTLLAAPLLRGNSIDYDTGTFMTGTLSGTFKAGTAIGVSITGSLHTIDLTTGPLVQFTTNCPTGSKCFDFTSGSVKVLEGSTVIFVDSLSGGLTLKTSSSGSVDAILATMTGLSSGSATASFSFIGGKITAGSENVAFNTGTVPELGTLFLFGSGLIGMAAKFRQKFL